jgi:phospholipid transport system substrate-binding protein
MRSSMVVRVLALIFTTLCLVRGADAGAPTDQIRTDIDELYRSVQPSASTGGQGQGAARAILDRMFDWTAMSEASLRGHWQKRTPAERAEFTKLFADLFARAYLSRINLVDATKFQYLGDAAANGRTSVKTKVLTKHGSAIDVDYLVHETPAKRWAIQDVQVEKISLIDNYRVQFDSIISRSSYDELVRRLRTITK